MRSVGNRGEDIAVQYLASKNIHILERNYQIRGGEIDIIAVDGDTYLFIEVKYRKDEQYGHPLDTLTPTKKRALSRTVRYYMMQNKIDPERVRIDFIGLMPKSGEIGHHVWWIKGIDI